MDVAAGPETATAADAPTAATDAKRGSAATYPGGPIAVQDFIATLTEWLCNWQVACGVMHDVEVCKAAGSPVFLFFVGIDQELTDIAAGKALWDAAAAGKCLHDLTDGCASLPSDACSAMITGTAALGAPCTWGYQCAAGWCKKPPGSPANCPGVCTAFLPSGGACKLGNLNEQCPPGEHCSAGKCTHFDRSKAGEAEIGCGGQTCASGQWCDYGATQAKCADGLAAGAPCTATYQCAKPLSCEGMPQVCTSLKINDTCNDNDRCPPGTVCEAGACRPVVGFGEACKGTKQCKAYDLHCGPAGTCVGAAAAGEPCVAAAYKTVCAPPLGCIAAKCAPLPGLGQACAPVSCKAFELCNQQRCAAGLACTDPSTDGSGTCQPIPGENEACVYICQPGLNCMDGAKGKVCAKPPCP